MRKLVFFIIILSVIGPLRGQTSYDVEYAQVCLIDSIAPDTVIQFWRFTQANNPGEYSVDMTFDLASSYTVEGTVLPCCSCLTEAMAANGGGGIGDIAMANPPPINALLLLSGAVLLALIIPRRKIAVLLILAAPAAVSAQPGTTYDIEHTCICLVDSIAADTVIQFWRFTQSNNPGEYSVDVTFDFGSSYTVAGTVLSCKDYYLGDNPGGSGTANTLAMWTGTSSLGNSSVTQSGTVLSSSFTGAFKPPSGTTVQQPVGSPGYFRFNTTASGFEGYNGSAYRFLPWADAIAPGAGRIWFQNSGNTEMTTSANVVYSSSEFRIGGSDMGAFGFQVFNQASNFGQNNSTAYFKIGTQGEIVQKLPGGYENSLTATGAAVHGTRIENTSTGALSSLKVPAYGESGLNIEIRTNANANPGIVFTEGGIGSPFSGRVYPLKFAIGRSAPASTTSPQSYSTGAGHGIEWEYVVQTSPYADIDAARLIPVLNGYRSSKMMLYLSDSANTKLYWQMIPDSGMVVSDYGDGTLQGTPTYTAAWNVDGKFIEVPEKWAAISTSTDGSGDIVVAHGMGTTPTSVQVTVTGTTPYVVTVHTIGATNFTVRFFDMAGAAVASTAVTATWHAKT